MEIESVIPPHLRRYVVRQSYDEYTEEDHAVWRFVVQQTHARLLRTAHEAYERGFAATGISIDRIPRIADVDERLSRFGWRAVCVDGFLPPRAFQAFQARGILPIAADIRTSRHLTYTPAPDIIHEAAGHAPFLAEPHYAHYIRRIGEVAEKAFGGPADRAVYEAIHSLSEIKENPASTAEEMDAASRTLEGALGPARHVSESVKIARLYWWTAEYGLVGSPSDYRLYGAGLLSSIGEGHFCRHPSVRKIPLTAGCIDVDFDITRAQPQLFVAKSLGQLEEVLDEVTATLAYRIGGDHALRAAADSEDTATLRLDSGAEVAGTVSRIHWSRDGTASLVELEGVCGIALGGALVDGLPRPTHYALPLGALADGTPLSSLSIDGLGRHLDASGRLRLRLASGLTVSGRVCALVPIGGKVGVALLSGFEIRRDALSLFRQDNPYPLALGHRIETASAAVPAGFFAPTALSETSVPKPRRFDSRARQLIALYDRATAAWTEQTSHRVALEFERILEHLDAYHPHEWLLRWNLLESLVKLRQRPDLARKLERDLEGLELHYGRREPIATGLEYVRSLMDHPGPSGRMTG